MTENPNTGFDAQNEKYVDMFEAGIIDPAKVVRTALQDAASVAGLLITTEALVAEKAGEEGPGRRRRRRRYARHGRHGLLAARERLSSRILLSGPRASPRGPFFCARRFRRR